VAKDWMHDRIRRRIKTRLTGVQMKERVPYTFERWLMVRAGLGVDGHFPLVNLGT